MLRLYVEIFLDLAASRRIIELEEFLSSRSASWLLN